MAEDAVDISSLSQTQQEVLQTYTAVTDQDLALAIPLLERSQWNVQIAIAKFFDGEGPDLLAEAQAAAASPARQHGRSGVLLDDFDGPYTTRHAPQRDVAPRIVPRPNDQTTYKPPALISLLLTPFNLLLRLLSNSLNLFAYLFPFLPRLLANFTRRNGITDGSTSNRRPLNPQDTAARYTRELEESYGPSNLPLYQGGYANAYDETKRDLKYLLVVIISPEHDDTPSFIRDILYSTEFRTFLNDTGNQVVLWSGSVLDSEAYQVSNALHATKLPFTALIAYTAQDNSSTMTTLLRLNGFNSVQDYISQLRNTISNHSQSLDQVRRQRAEQDAARNLRQEQFSAYERSLAQDRARDQKRREEEQARVIAEQEMRDKEEAAIRLERQARQWRLWRAGQLRPEPDASVKDASRISIRMRDGQRIIRKFAPDSEIEEIYSFVDCHEVLPSSSADAKSSPPANYEHQFGFRLVSPMPRTVYDIASGGKIGAQVGRSANLIVEPIDDDESDDDDNETDENAGLVL